MDVLSGKFGEQSRSEAEVALASAAPQAIPTLKAFLVLFKLPACIHK